MMDQYFNPRVLKILVGIVVLLLAVSIFLLRFGKPSFSESQVDMRIEGEGQIESGEEMEWKFIIENKTKTDLTNLVVNFTYPVDSVVIDEEGKVVDRRDHKFTITKIESGQSEKKEFKAFVVGERGDIRLAYAKMSFRAGSIRSSFEKTAELATTITSVPVSLTLAAAPNVLPNQNIIYTLDYRNESKQDISDVRFMFQYPDGFTVIKTTPNATTGKNIWTDETLKKSESGRITVEGSLSARQGETKEVVAVLERKLGENYIAHAKARASSVIASPLLSINIEANDSSEYISHTGDTIRYTLKYKNNSNFNLAGLTVSALLEGEMFDFNSISAPKGYFDSSSRTVIWDPGSSPDLSRLEPNEEGELYFTARLRSSFPGGRPGNYFVKASAKIATANVPSGYDGNEIWASSQIVTRIGTQPGFNQIGFFNDPDYGSSGAVPPKVGQETTVTIHWIVSNPGNDMRNASVRATLPSGVIWRDNASVGAGQKEPIFNPNTSEVIWELGSVPQGIGLGSSPYEATFQVSFTPNASQVGTAVTLVKDAKLTGTDAFTSQRVTVTKGDLSTSQLGDAGGNGTVVP